MSYFGDLGSFGRGIQERRCASNAAQVVERQLKDQSYDDKMVPTWANYICEDMVQGLNELGKPFKYIGAHFERSQSLKCRPRAHRGSGAVWARMRCSA